MRQCRETENSRSLFFVQASTTADLLKFVDRFVTEISWEESDLAKSEKLRALMLTDGEWERLKAFIDLLGVRLNIGFLRFAWTNLEYNTACR